MAVAIIVAVALGACSTDSDVPAEQLSDEQARAQVVDPARQIARLNHLGPDAYAEFSFSSCDDLSEGVSRGVVRLNFRPPTGTSADAYFDRIAATMAGADWTDGPPPGWHGYGRVIHTAEVVAILGAGPAAGWANAELTGECRNVDDHRGDGGFDWQRFALN